MPHFERPHTPLPEMSAFERTNVSRDRNHAQQFGVLPHPTDSQYYAHRAGQKPEEFHLQQAELQRQAAQTRHQAFSQSLYQPHPYDAQPHPYDAQPHPYDAQHQQYDAYQRQQYDASQSPHDAHEHPILAPQPRRTFLPGQLMSPTDQRPETSSLQPISASDQRTTYDTQSCQPRQQYEQSVSAPQPSRSFNPSDSHGPNWLTPSQWGDRTSLAGPSTRPPDAPTTTTSSSDGPLLRAKSPGGRNWDLRLDAHSGRLLTGEIRRIEQARGKPIEGAKPAATIHDLRRHTRALGWTLLSDPPKILRAKSPGGRSWDLRLDAHSGRLLNGETKRIERERGKPIEGAKPSATIHNLRRHTRAQHWTVLSDPFSKPQ
jgi:hypothetical protein